MKLYNTAKGLVCFNGTRFFNIDKPWDDVVNENHLYKYLVELAATTTSDNKLAEEWIATSLLPPVGQQEVWAAGVTYLRSRDARMEESSASGGATLYDKVYEAARPELFFKSLPHRVRGHGQAVQIRSDSEWNVPEPECTLFINSHGKIAGYSIGNDMSSRSIEGENALYLPQAKVYEGSAAIGPCLYVPEMPLALSGKIRMRIRRGDRILYDDETPMSRMKRSFEELATYLFAGCDFPHGVYLMTGTCLVPESGFTLQENDEVFITIDEIGELINKVEWRKIR